MQLAVGSLKESNVNWTKAAHSRATDRYRIAFLGPAERDNRRDESRFAIGEMPINLKECDSPGQSPMVAGANRRPAIKPHK
jgi:hypothetical protein